mgnify:CR=1 FL=1
MMRLSEVREYLGGIRDRFRGVSRRDAVSKVRRITGHPVFYAVLCVVFGVLAYFTLIEGLPGFLHPLFTVVILALIVVAYTQGSDGSIVVVLMGPLSVSVLYVLACIVSVWEAPSPFPTGVVLRGLKGIFFLAVSIFAANQLGFLMPVQKVLGLREIQLNEGGGEGSQQPGPRVTFIDVAVEAGRRLGRVVEWLERRFSRRRGRRRRREVVIL